MDLDLGFQLDDWLVSPRQGTLTRGAEVAQLEPKAMGVLVCLARHAGEVVKRDELLQEVWPGVVVQEEVLNRSISLLRSSLKDDHREPRYIQTIARRGYRLVAPVRPIPEAQSRLHKITAPAILGNALMVVIVAMVAYLAGRSTEDNGPEWIPGSEIISLAVLPFVDLSSGDDQGNFSAGLTAEIMSDLSRVEGLRVMLRDRNPDEDVCAAGQRLDAATLLSGSLRRDGERLWVGGQWVNASDCYQILTETYERKLDDIFEVQHAISEAIVSRLASALGTDLASVQPAEPPPSAGAYQPFLLGRHNLILGVYDLEQRGEESIRRSIELFQNAIERDPDLAEAHLRLAEAYILLPTYVDGMPESDKALLRDRALAALARVAELDGNPNRTYAARAFIHTINMEWIDAEQLFRLAIAVEPNDANLHYWYSQFLARVGYIDRSLEQAKLARDLDDVSPPVMHRLGISYLWAGRNDLAGEHFALARNAGYAVFPEPDLILLHRLNKHDEMTRMLSRIHEDKGLLTAWIAPVIDALKHPDDAVVRHRGIAELARAAEAGELAPNLAWGALILLQQPQLAFVMADELIRNNVYLLEFVFADEAAVVRTNPLVSGFIERLQLARFWDLYGWPELCERIEEAISCR